MQLTIQDGILLVRTSHGYIYTEHVNYADICTYFLTCGYRYSTAQAIAYGLLADRNATIQLAQLVKLLAVQ